ncbi:MAG: hypothetical protein QXM27_02150 [Candidatus Pacearchaeota archaeon]
MKSQIHIQEMAFVLVALILLFALVMLTFAMFQTAKTKQLAKSLQREKIVSMLDSIANMPEFSCKKAYCLDEEKIIAYIEKADKKIYKNLWEKSKIALIKVERVYPNIEGKCNKSNYPNCKTYIIYDSGKNYEAYSTFMPLCYYDYEFGSTRCDIAKLIVGFEIPK